MSGASTAREAPMGSNPAPLPPVVLHMGFTKTGSTWFRDRWAQHPNIEIVLRSRPLDEQFIRPNRDEFTASDAAAHLGDNIATVRGVGKVPIISRESLGPGLNVDASVQRAVERIRDVAPDLIAWIVLRRQDEWLLSQWQQRVKYSPGTPSLPRFVSADGEWPTIAARWLAVLDYDAVVRKLENLLGPDQVHVDLYEAFADDAGAFIRRADETMRLPTGKAPMDPSRRLNASMSVAAANQLRRMQIWMRLREEGGVYAGRNRWALHWVKGLDQRRGRPPATSDPDIKAVLQPAVSAAFGASNRRLAARRPEIDMARFDYPGCNP